ncbi:cyanidin 3-O-glucoside 7-O-glucosyltransferase (acyl-glucose)-like [Cryptomeria japonica]|uniref:cyanidin 3-O-glucoside 7-O-glucosyltransferase (acyl-glucose)-like n=1 Tax=Cryptomeria japonica TaxID=3369 RepID=UPI0027DA058E|nr:cyanidin 3-O-glucoside 7-O-glucosyltransferase (acyl-glucose)-like [Cryptomeria japonica]
MNKILNVYKVARVREYLETLEAGASTGFLFFCLAWRRWETGRYVSDKSPLYGDVCNEVSGARDTSESPMPKSFDWLLLNREDFRAFAEVCLREFGDRVKHWTTFNEPNAFPTLSYDIGWWPPERCSYPFGYFGNCSAGDSTVEPYIVGHHVLLSHAEVVEVYREKFQTNQNGFIGLAIVAIVDFDNVSLMSKDIHEREKAEQTYSIIGPLLVFELSPLSSQSEQEQEDQPHKTQCESDVIKSSTGVTLTSNS